MNEFLSLNDIKPGESAWVRELTSTGSIRRRLLDIGLVAQTKVECLGKSPAGDPGAYLIRGAVIAIRSEDCRNILVQLTNEAQAAGTQPSGERSDKNGTDSSFHRNPCRRHRAGNPQADAAR